MRQPQCKVFWSSRHFIIILHVGYLWLALLQLDTVPGNCWIFHRTFQMQSKMIIPTIPNCCKNCRNNSGSREGTASAGRKRHAVATWTGILVVRICGIFFSVGLQVLMFWFCQGVPRALCCACKNTLSPCQESPFWSFFFYRIFLGNGVQNAKVAKKSRNECNKRLSDPHLKPSKGGWLYKWSLFGMKRHVSQQPKSNQTIEKIFPSAKATTTAPTMAAPTDVGTMTGAQRLRAEWAYSLLVLWRLMTWYRRYSSLFLFRFCHWRYILLRFRILWDPLDDLLRERPSTFFDNEWDDWTITITTNYLL